MLWLQLLKKKTIIAQYGFLFFINQSLILNVLIYSLKVNKYIASCLHFNYNSTTHKFVGRRFRKHCR